MKTVKHVLSAMPVGFLVAMFLLGCSARIVHAESASRYYKAGQEAEEQNDIISAYEAFKQAYELKPAEIKYRTTYERVRASAAAEYVKEGETFETDKNLAGALAAFLKALDADPGNELADADARKLEDHLQQKDRSGQVDGDSAQETVNPASPVRLDLAATGPVTLHMIEDSKIIYQSLGKMLGVNVLFDPDYTSKHIQIDLRDVTPYESLHILSEVSNTFWKPVTHNTIFVAQDTRAKRQQLSQQALQIFYLKNVSQQNDFTDLQTALRNVFQTAKIYGLASDNAIVMRGTPDELQLAKMMIADLDRPKPEVMVDVTVMEVSRDKLRDIGLSPPTSLTINSGSSQTLEQIGHTSAYSITIGQAAAEFLLTDSDSRILQNPRLRALDGQKADLKLGEKLPVATGSYTYPTGTSGSAAETQFQYLDVGVNIEMTPEIHSDRDVTLKLSVEVSAENGTEDLEGVNEPIISQEKADQVVRLKDGEATILAGLVSRQVTQSVNGWPGFGEVPLMKYLFTTRQHEVKTDELVFMIVPHVVRAPQSDTNMEREIDTGTETAIQLRDASTTQGISSPAQP